MCLGSKPCDCLTRVRGRGTDGVDGGWLRRYRFAIGAVSQLSHARNAITTGKAHRVPRRLSHPFRTRTAGHRPSREGTNLMATRLPTVSTRSRTALRYSRRPMAHHQITTKPPKPPLTPPKPPSDGISCRPRVTGAVTPFDGPIRSPSNTHGRSTGRPPSEVRLQTPSPIRITRVDGPGPPGTHGRTRTASARRP